VFRLNSEVRTSVKVAGATVAEVPSALRTRVLDGVDIFELLD
jgi:hypothetical protein